MGYSAKIAPTLGIHTGAVARIAKMHPSDAIDAIRPSVAQIAVDDGSHERSVLGTGFIAHQDGFVLTAMHVAEAARVAASEGGSIVVRLAMPTITGPITIRGSFEVLAGEIIGEDVRHDLAVLRMVDNPYTQGKPSGVFQTPEGGTGINALYGVARLDESPVRDGESVGVSGYPMNEPALISTFGTIASAFGVDMVAAEVPGAPDGFFMPDVADSYLADVSVNPGNSGGPVYRVEGAAVIGVCVAFRVANAAPHQGTAFSYNSGLAVVVPIRYAMSLIDAVSHH